MAVTNFSTPINLLEIAALSTDVSCLVGQRKSFSPDAMKSALNGARRVVIWGHNFLHTHYWVTVAYYRTLVRMNIPVIWCDDHPSNAEEIGVDDIVIYHHGNNQNIPKRPQRGFIAFRRDFMAADVVDWLDRFPGVYLWQQSVTSSGSQLDDCTWYNPTIRALYQPWGTDLLPWEFYDPVSAYDSSTIFWIGTIWSSNPHNPKSDWGNVSEMKLLHDALQRHDIKMVQIEDGYTEANASFVRASRLGLSIQGSGQTGARHLACRFFKNVSYGTFPVSNNFAARQLVKDAAVYSPDIGELVDAALSITPERAAEMVRAAQDVVRDYTIGANLYVSALVIQRQMAA
jgi:hypothetical protein